MNQAFWLEGDEARHLVGSRRVRLAEKVEVQGPDFLRFSCKIITLERRQVQLLPLEPIPTPAEPALKIWLHQGMIKGKPLDWLLQKAVELGAAGVTLFPSDYSQPIPKAKDQAKKLERWRKIMVEAAKQSGRLCPPRLEISAVNLLHQLDDRQAFVFDPYKKPYPLKSKGLNGSDVHLFFGPEAGFSKQELQQFKGEFLSLGPRILRAETAAVTGLTLFGGLFGDLVG